MYLLRELYIVTTHEGKSTENFWRVISKSIKSNTIFFSCSFPFTSIIQPLEKCHSICKPNNLRTHCSAKNWSNVNTMSFFANSLSTVATKMVSRVDGSVLNGLVFINFLKVSRIRREKEGKIENSGDTIPDNTMDRYNRHDSIDITNVTLSHLACALRFFGWPPTRELNLNRENQTRILTLNASRVFTRPTISRNLP